MSRLPNLVALLDGEPSAEFAEAMRVRLFGELVEATDAEETSTSPTVDASDDDDTVVLVGSKPPHRRRAQVLFGSAAAAVLVGALAVALLARRSEPTAIDPHRDAEIAQRALVPVEDLGNGWSISHEYDDYTTRVAFDVAATVPSCDPYVDHAFDSPRRDAVASQMRYQSPRSFTLWDVVYVFPSESAASLAMDKIAEPAFQDCFTTYLEAATPVIDPGGTSTSEVVETPPLVEHGDRQVAFATFNVYQTPNGPVPQTTINVFIQIDRAIVYVNPVPDFHADTDPHSQVEIAMSRATDSVRAALGG